MCPTLVPEPERWLSLAASSRDASGLEHTAVAEMRHSLLSVTRTHGLSTLCTFRRQVWLRSQLPVADNKQYVWDSWLSVTHRGGRRGICCPRDVRSDPASRT